MVKFGFSLYPEHYDVATSKAYIDKLYRAGARRLFLSLLQIAPDDTQTFQKYQTLVSYARALNIEVIADVSPGFIRQMGWQERLIDEVHAFGLSGIRLDEALELEAIVALTNNPYGIRIELNMSTDERLLVELLNQPVNKSNIIGCHNFYPHALTGLSTAHFLKMTQLYHEHGIRTAAFVNAQSADEGPWLVNEGLCTVEAHRHLPIDVQIEWLKGIGMIDEILLANQFIADDELACVEHALRSGVLTFVVTPVVSLTAVEKQIIEYPHIYRGDISEYVIRSTQPRLEFAQSTIEPRMQDKQVERGVILIDNDLYNRYKGELQISLREFTLTEKTNRVAQIVPEYLILLEVLKPWQPFALVIREADEHNIV